MTLTKVHAKERFSIVVARFQSHRSVTLQPQPQPSEQILLSKAGAAVAGDRILSAYTMLHFYR